MNLDTLISCVGRWVESGYLDSLCWVEPGYLDIHVFLFENLDFLHFYFENRVKISRRVVFYILLYIMKITEEEQKKGCLMHKVHDSALKNR